MIYQRFLITLTLCVFVPGTTIAAPPSPLPPEYVKAYSAAGVPPRNIAKLQELWREKQLYAKCGRGLDPESERLIEATLITPEQIKKARDYLRNPVQLAAVREPDLSWPTPRREAPKAESTEYYIWNCLAMGGGNRYWDYYTIPTTSTIALRLNRPEPEPYETGALQEAEIAAYMRLGLTQAQVNRLDTLVRLMHTPQDKAAEDQYRAEIMQIRDPVKSKFRDALMEEWSERRARFLAADGPCSAVP